MKKKELEDKIIEYESLIFDLKAQLQQKEMFEKIADEKLEEWVDKYYKLLAKYKNDKKNRK